MSLVLFTKMLDTVIVMDNDRLVKRYVRELLSAYRGNADFRAAVMANQAAFLARLADVFAASAFAQFLQWFPAISDDDVQDAFIKGKSGRARVNGAFKLLLVYHKAARFGKVAALAQDMLQRIDSFVDESRILTTIQLGESLQRENHVVFLVATASWTEVKALVAAWGDVDQQTEFEQRIDHVERRTVAADTAESIEAAADVEPDARMKLHLLRKAYTKQQQNV